MWEKKIKHFWVLLDVLSLGISSHSMVQNQLLMLISWFKFSAPSQQNKFRPHLHLAQPTGVTLHINNSSPFPQSLRQKIIFISVLLSWQERFFYIFFNKKGRFLRLQVLCMEFFFSCPASHGSNAISLVPNLWTLETQLI